MESKADRLELLKTLWLLYKVSLKVDMILNKGWINPIQVVRTSFRYGYAAILILIS